MVGLLLASVLAIGLIVMLSTRTKTSPVEEEDVGPPHSFHEYFSEIYVPVKGFGESKPRPSRIRRTTDEVLFEPIAKGIYLPLGYQAEDGTQLVNGWPRVIVRHGIRFIRIQGDFEWVMGAWDDPVSTTRDDAPAHPVFLSGYYMQETEVTNGQIEDYLNKTEGTAPADWKEVFEKLRRDVGDNDARRHPAVNLSLNMAKKYANYLGGLIPTEAQWEFAARSRGQERRYAWGNHPQPSRDIANINRIDQFTTTPVMKCEKDRTEQGLFDMGGNVQEWCRDASLPYKKTKIAAVDPCAIPKDPSTPEFVIRGASYNSAPDECATTLRDFHRPETDQSENLGFRLVIECPDARKPR